MLSRFHILYVLVLLLLQLFNTGVLAQTLTQTSQQKQQLIARYGLLETKDSTCNKTLRKLKIKNTCSILNSNLFNAYAFTEGSIMITKGLLQKTHNVHQLAHILAHEQAHLVLKHHHQLSGFMSKPPLFFPKRKRKKLRYQQELEADQWANQRLKTYQFMPQQIHHLWKRLLQQGQPPQTDHPSLKQRIDTSLLREEEMIDNGWITKNNKL